MYALRMSDVNKEATYLLTLQVSSKYTSEVTIMPWKL